MSTSVVYYPHAIYLGGTGTTISQLQDVTPAHNYQDLTEFSASQAVPQFTGTHQAAPDSRFKSPDLSAILALTTDYNVAKNIAALGDVDIEYKAGKNFGVRISDASLLHFRARAAANTMLVWESFTARQGQIVELQCRLCHVFSSGAGVDPLVFTSGVALAQASAINSLFTLGPVKLNGTFVEAVEEMTWNNNVQYEEVTSDGDAFWTYVAVKSIAPEITFSTRDAALMATLGTRSLDLSALSVFLRKKLQSGINVPDGTASHIKLSATMGTAKGRQITSGDKTSLEVSIKLASSAQNTAPFSMALTSAIS